MEQLRIIMSNLVDIEYSLGSLSSLLDLLEEIYDLKHEEELKENVWIFRMIVKSLSENLSENISEIDQFILENKGK